MIATLLWHGKAKDIYFYPFLFSITNKFLVPSYGRQKEPSQNLHRKTEMSYICQKECNMNIISIVGKTYGNET